MEDDLMIEVTGSANKATSALDKVISKLSQMQSAFDKAVPSLKKVSDMLDSMATSSKAVSAIKLVSESTSKSALSAKDAESKMAMYQARLDRATVSSAKLAAAQEKLKQAANFDVSNKQFLDNFKYNPTPNIASPVNKYSEPLSTDVFVPTPAVGTSRLASEMSPSPSPTSFKLNTAGVTSSVDQVRAQIDRLSPSISKMGGEANLKFSNLSSELMRISSQIDNQRALYSQLASAATKAANANGEGSTKYLQLEKRMLSADGAIDKLIAKQDKLRAKISEISADTEKSSSGFSLFGDKASKGSSSATSGFAKTLNMMDKMFIRIIAFRLFSMVQKSITDGINNIAQASDKANASLSAMSASTLYLKNSIASVFAPVIQALTPIIVQATDAIANLFNMLGMLNARIFGGSTSVTVARKANVDYAASIAKSGAAADAAKKSIMGFDELNNLNSNKSSSSSGVPSPTDMFQETNIPSGILSFGDKIKSIFSEWRTYAQPTIDAFNRLKTSLQPIETFAAKGAIDFYNDFLKPIGKWTLGTAIPTMLDTVGKFSKDVDWKSINKSLDDLWKAVEPFTEKVGDGLLWFLQKVLEPVAAWAVSNVVPRSIDAVKEAIKLLSELIDKDKPNLQWFYDDFLVPLGKWSGGTFLSAMDTVNGVLKTLNDVLSGDIPQAVKDAEKSFGDYGEFLRKLFKIPELDGKNWLQKGVLIVNGVLNGISDGLRLFANPGTYLGSKVIDGFTSKLNINIPKTWGSDIVNGLKQGLGDVWASISSAFNKVITEIKKLFSPEAIQRIGQNATDAFITPFKNIQWPKLKSPHFNFSWDANGWGADVFKTAFGWGGTPNLNVDWYKTGGLFSAPSVIGVGEGKDSEAVIPLNDQVFSSISKGIVENGGSSSGYESDRIVESINQLKNAIRDIQVVLYADDRAIAQSSNRGNARIDKSYHPIATS